MTLVLLVYLVLLDKFHCCFSLLAESLVLMPLVVVVVAVITSLHLILLNYIRLKLIVRLNSEKQNSWMHLILGFDRGFTWEQFTDRGSALNRQRRLH